MSAYEGSKMQENDENSKKYSSKELIDIAVSTVKSMGITEAHQQELQRAYDRGYQAAINRMKDVLGKMFPV